MLLGRLAGGWKLDGPPGRPSCWDADCIPGAGPTPGAEIPGGGAMIISERHHLKE